MFAGMMTVFLAESCQNAQMM